MVNIDERSYRYDGKRALIVGGATGTGAATAALRVADSLLRQERFFDTRPTIGG